MEGFWEQMGLPDMTLHYRPPVTGDAANQWATLDEGSLVVLPTVPQAKMDPFSFPPSL